jgi:hemolysin type calcium-binding protein/WD40 repeat protein/predicted actin-binding protein
VKKRLRPVLLPLAALAAAVLPLSAAQAGSFAGDNGPIAYTCGTDVCRISPDGSGKITLLTGATDPSWSSDESRLAFVDPVNGVSVADPDGTNRHALGAGATSTQPTFSEDGLRVAYAKSGDLWSILSNTTGQELHLTSGTATDADPAYSPDGSRIAFARDSGSGYDIWTLDLSGGSSPEQQVTSVAGDERSPTWSPTGGTIVYTGSSNGHLFAVSPSGGAPTDLNVVGKDPAYSPDGTKIAFIDAAGHLASIPAAVAATPTVTAVDSAGTLSQPDWQAIVAPTPTFSGPPKNVSYPTINLEFGDSSPIVGHFLTASVGTWDGTFPISYTYQWKRCVAADPVNGPCFDIAGASSSFYTPVAEDAGMRLRVQVTATNSDGSFAQNSEVSEIVVAIAPTLRSTPEIVGDNTVDATLTLTDGIWDGSTPIAFTYSWRRCNPQGDPESCVEIPGATSSSYTPTVQDVGSAIRVWITGTNPAGSDLAITNHTFPIVDKPHLAPTASTQPAIAGTAAVGRQLTADKGSYAGDDPLQSTIVWERCDATGAHCHALAKAKKTVYVPTPADVGSTLRIAVTTTNNYGSLATSSDPTEAVAALPPHHRGRHLVGTRHADYKAGGGYDDTISGLGGNDTLPGGAGNDRIDGGPGNDVIVGGPGADRLFGGPGSDTIYAADGQRDVVDCGPGRDRAVADSFDKVAHCEVVDSAAAP